MIFQHPCPKCGKPCRCYPDEPGECSHDCTPEPRPAQPSESPSSSTQVSGPDQREKKQ
jgi:hypothetical protein